MVDRVEAGDKHKRINHAPKALKIATVATRITLCHAQGSILKLRRGPMRAHISVDGSNVLFWCGGQKRADAPEAVTRALIARRFAPVVYFDHSIHRHMPQSSLDALAALAPVVIADKGTPADTLLLETVAQGQIVSNDRYRDWRAKVPHLRNSSLVTGHIGKGGRVCFSKKLRPAPL